MGELLFLPPSIGIDADYQSTWRGSLSYTNTFGVGFDILTLDRDFIMSMRFLLVLILSRRKTTRPRKVSAFRGFCLPA
ncbi:hypothetical protein [uncultured Parvibaculum sp.]|jgi:hypothetical protein|uniref:hypothetical protein n=1 Tax=Parvibaculum sp. TaxID=2024848 RepID=UPI0030D89AA1